MLGIPTPDAAGQPVWRVIGDRDGIGFIFKWDDYDLDSAEFSYAAMASI
jgi:hypothetical protein